MNLNTSREKWFISIVIFVTIIVSLVWFLCFCNRSRKTIRNVLIISIDTCRADYLNCYGYSHKVTTPNIDAIAGEGILFENAISPVPMTLPAHSSMLIGTIPPYHGVHDNHDYRLAPSNITLAEILHENGFYTGAIISSFVLDSYFGLDQGFSFYDDSIGEEFTAHGINERKAEHTSLVAIEWLRKHKSESFFLFLHYFDPHAPYMPPEPFASRFADNLYAGEVAYVDHCIGQVVTKLKELGLYDETLVVITSDHGEMLGEHGEMSHGYFIYQSAIKVPLIFKLPGLRQSRRIKEPVGLVDIVPTICSLLSIEPPGPIHGIDLSDYFAGRKKTPVHERPIYCENLTTTRYNANSLFGVVTDRWKYIQTTRPELYDLAKDPQELDNLFAAEPNRARVLKDHLTRMLENQVRKDSPESEPGLNVETRKRLESLGYLAIGAISEDFAFDQTKTDPKDLIDLHNAAIRTGALFFDGEYDKAAVLCEKILMQQPNFTAGHFYMAEIAKKRKDYAKATSFLYRMIEIKPDNAVAHNNLGHVLELQGKDDEAINHYRRAIEIKPDYVEPHNNLGFVLMSQNKLTEAISFYRKALKLNPDLSMTHNNLALALRMMDKVEQAAKHFREALRLRPDWAAPLNELAWILATQPNSDLNERKEALNLALRAAELTRRQDSNVLDTLAASYASVGQFDQAVATAQKALELASASKNIKTVNTISKRLRLYKQSKPYRESMQEKANYD